MDEKVLYTDQDIINGLQWIVDTHGVCKDCPDDEGKLCEKFSQCIPAICEAAIKRLDVIKYLDAEIMDLMDVVGEYRDENASLKTALHNICDYNDGIW